MIPIPFQVNRRVQLTHDVFELELIPVQKRDYSFAPGQFNMLYLFGVGEVPISLSSDPNETSSLVHTIRSVGTVTKAMSEVKQGDVLGLRGPFGSQWPIEEAIGKDVVLITGGIGLAPLRPVLYSLLAQREKIGRIILLYGAREPDDLLYQKQLESWQQSHRLEVLQTVDVADRNWQGTVGVVTKLIPKVTLNPEQTIAMICGPEIMMRFAILELEAIGMRDHQLYISMERNMKCAVGFCGHCQFGPTFLCKDGPVLRYDQIRHFFGRREI